MICKWTKRSAENDAKGLRHCIDHLTEEEPKELAETSECNSAFRKTREYAEIMWYWRFWNLFFDVFFQTNLGFFNNDILFLFKYLGYSAPAAPYSLIWVRLQFSSAFQRLTLWSDIKLQRSPYLNKYSSVQKITCSTPTVLNNLFPFTEKSKQYVQGDSDMSLQYSTHCFTHTSNSPD